MDRVKILIKKSFKFFKFYLFNISKYLFQFCLNYFHKKKIIIEFFT